MSVPQGGRNKIKSNNSLYGVSALRVTRHASRIDFAFRGKWLVNYDPKEFKYPDILITLAQIQDVFKDKNSNFNSINIKFNNYGDTNYFYQENNDVFLSFCRLDKVFVRVETKPCEPAVVTPLEKPIKTVSLLFPRLESDPRWKTMGLPAAQLLLDSSLQAQGFQPTPILLSLPGAIVPPGALQADMAGFTVFEDLLPSLGPFLARFKAVYGGWLAAGGPFPTLAPLAAVFHLLQVNLFVRGEAEMTFPAILDALNRGDSQALWEHQGVFWQQPGLIVMADFDQINRPEDFSAFQADLSFLQAQHLAHGLEINFSRGCGRGCVFCCRAQGSRFRKLPLAQAEDILQKYGDTLAGFNLHDGQARAVNINDDDILQDPAYAAAVFAMVKKHEFRIMGIQTSPAALLSADGCPAQEVLDLAAEPGLFVEDRPLLWLGTDAFLPARARRLGKKLPPAEKFAALLAAMEKRGLRHFHYWISSDLHSTWEEFIAELALICRYQRDFPNFGLLAHAPFIVPYPASRMFGRLPAGDRKLKLKLELHAPDARFSYKVVERLETKHINLNKLLHNEKAGGEFGFFDLLKAKNFIAAAQLAYHYLKQEQLQSSAAESDNLASGLRKLEGLIQSII